MIRKLFAFGLAVVLALMPVQAFGKKRGDHTGNSGRTGI